jgi:hypothetical protein
MLISSNDAPAPPTDEALLLSRRDSARLLGIGTTTLDALIRAQVLRTVRIRRRLLVVRDSILQYVTGEQHGS